MVAPSSSSVPQSAASLLAMLHRRYDVIAHASSTIGLQWLLHIFLKLRATENIGGLELGLPSLVQNIIKLIYALHYPI